MSTPPRRRVLPICLVAVALFLPLLGATTASGDALADKQAEANRIAAQIDRLQERAEMYAEQYNTAKVELGALEQKVAGAEADLRRTRAVTAQRRKELTRYAVGAYTSGHESGLDFLLADSGSEAAKRQGYSQAALGDKADLVDALRAAVSDGEAKVGQLRRSRTAARQVRADMGRKGDDAASAAASEQKLLDRVRGELKGLVAAEQARRAAAAAREADAAMRRLASVAERPAEKATGSGARAAGPTSRRSGGSAPASPASSGPVPAVGQGAGAAIAAARSQLGVPYRWGAESPGSGFDCSGLTSWAWGRAGKSLPHSSSAQYSMARKIPISALQPGDLVFYGSPIHHVALYIGGGQILHAPHTGDVVKIANLNLSGDIVGGGRV